MGYICKFTWVVFGETGLFSLEKLVVLYVGRNIETLADELIDSACNCVSDRSLRWELFDVDAFELGFVFLEEVEDKNNVLSICHKVGTGIF